MNEPAGERGDLSRLEALFHEVLAVPPPEREALLQRSCQGDAWLLAEVRALVQASDDEDRLGRERIAGARANADAAAEGRRIGPYALERLLGRGGMGSVYLAHRADGQFEQRLAIKLVDLPLATDLFRERFRIERQILAGLVHPYIARLLDGGVSDAGDLFLALEYVDGVPITAFCETHRLALRERLELFLKVLSAVQFAHQNLIVHRDLKPDNILVAADGTPRLLDFGTAKLLLPAADGAAGFTQHGLQAFTPNYASPEQVLGEAITTASDTYSLGVLLYLLLAGVPPYAIQEFTTGELLRVVCKEEPPAPSIAAALAGKPQRLDADLDAIVGKALRKEPQQRYVTVEQLSADIEAYLAGRPVAARRGTHRYRAYKFMRRNRLPLAIAALLLLSLAFGSAAVMRQSHVANEQRQRAEARSEDLRQLSSSLLSEIDEAIKELPGSTPVQRLLVARVLDHLDRMSSDADTDQITDRDLVEAYTRLGNLQGNPYEQNIGDAAGAERSLDKAIRIARALEVRTPHEPAVLAALALAEQSRGEVLFGVGRTPEAIESMRAAVADYDARNALPGAGSAEFAAAASAVGALGDLLGQSGVSSLGDQAGALEAYRKAMQLSERALQVEPGFVRAQRGVAIDHLKIGNILLITDPGRASTQYLASLQAWQALPQAEQDAASTRRGIAQTHLKMAAAAAATDDFPQAIREMEAAGPTLEYLAGADADDSRVTYDLAEFYAAKAQLFIDALDVAPPLERGVALEYAQNAALLLRRSLPIVEHLVTLNPANRSWAANLAFEQATLGSLEFSYGLKKDAEQRAANALSALKTAVSSDDATVDVLELAATAGLVMPPRLRDTHWTRACAQRLVAATRQRNPAHLLLLARAAQADGQAAEAAASAREGLALLADGGGGNGPSRLRRGLQRLSAIG